MGVSGSILNLVTNYVMLSASSAFLPTIFLFKTTNEAGDSTFPIQKW